MIWYSRPKKLTNAKLFESKIEREGSGYMNRSVVFYRGKEFTGVADAEEVR